MSILVRGRHTPSHPLGVEGVVFVAHEDAGALTQRSPNPVDDVERRREQAVTSEVSFKGRGVYDVRNGDERG